MDHGIRPGDLDGLTPAEWEQVKGELAVRARNAQTQGRPDKPRTVEEYMARAS